MRIIVSTFYISAQHRALYNISDIRQLSRIGGLSLTVGAYLLWLVLKYLYSRLYGRVMILVTWTRIKLLLPLFYL